MTVEQSQECFEHHMTLKSALDKISCTLFGCPEKPNYIPIVTKVRIMFSILIFLATSSLAVLGGVITLSVKIGVQLEKIQNMSVALDNHIEHSEIRLQQHENRLTGIEYELARYERTEYRKRNEL